MSKLSAVGKNVFCAIYDAIGSLLSRSHQVKGRYEILQPPPELSGKDFPPKHVVVLDRPIIGQNGVETGSVEIDQRTIVLGGLIPGQRVEAKVARQPMTLGGQSRAAMIWKP